MSLSFAEVSQAGARAVADLGDSIVRVEGRRRHGASGIVWAADGLILAANHTVRRDRVVVGLADGSELEAEIVGRDSGTDVALLRIPAQDLKPATWVSEEDVGVGSLVYAVARPGQTVQASLGTLSAVGGPWRSGGGGKVSHFLRLDLVMYPGFSGGAVLGAGGVVGMATSGFTREGGIALGRTTVTPIVESILEHGEVRRGYLGVGLQSVNLPGGLAAELGQEQGLLLNSVESEGPAEKSGLVVGDILVELEGERLQRADDLALVLQNAQPGSSVHARRVRGGQLEEIEVTVGAR